MSKAFASQFGLKIRKTNIRAQKIDGYTLKTYGIVIPTLSMLDMDDRERFFEKSFLLANIKLNVMLGILFLIINNANVDFQAWDL